MTELVLGINASGARTGASRFNRSADSITRSARTATNSVNRVEGSFSRLKSGAVALSGALAGVSAALVLRSGIQTIAQFSQEISTLEAVTGATSDQMQVMSERARELGGTTRFSATQAAEGMTFLARAGFDVNESLSAIEGTLNLAQAGALNLGRAADIASNVLQGFRLQASEAGRVSDVLAASAASANTNVEQMGNAMSFAAPVAAGLGVEVEETAAAVGVLSDAGIQGQRAGTGLRRVMAALESPTSKMLGIFEDLGVEAEDVRVSNVGLTAALEELAEAGVTAGQGMELFGQRGGPAFEVMQAAIPRIREMTGELEGAEGAAQSMSETMDDNLNGALLQLSAAFESLVLEVGESGARGGLRAAVEGVTGALRFLADNADRLVQIVGTVGTVLTARLVGPLAMTAAQSFAASSAMATLGANLATIQGRAIAAQGAIAGLRRGMAMLGGPVGVAILAGSALFSYAQGARAADQDTGSLIKEIDSLTQSYKNLRVERIDDLIDQTTQAMERQRNQIAQFERADPLAGGDGGDRFVDEIREANDALADLGDRLVSLREKRTDILSSTEIRTLNEEMGRLDETIDRVSRRFDAANDSAEEFMDTLDPFARGSLRAFQDSIVSVEEFAEQWGRVTPKVEAANDGLDDMPGKIGQVDRAARELQMTFSSAFEDAIVAGEGLRSVLRGILQDILRIIVRQNITQPAGQAMAGAFSGMFTSGESMEGFAQGGITDKPAIFGEGSMREAAVPLPDGRSIPVTMKDGGGTTVNQNISISADGADPEQLARLTQAVRAMDKTFERRAVASVQDARSRGRAR